LNDRLVIAEGWHDRLASAGFDELSPWFEDERVRVWRDLPERQNATLELAGQPRLHVKRHKQDGSAVADELRGIRLLGEADIPTVEVVAHGPRLLVLRDLTGLRPADRLPFDRILRPTAELAAKVHAAGLHHRDFHPCHFFLDEGGERCHLIDAGRVRRLPPLTRRRWVIKDLAQFVNGLDDRERGKVWLDAYGPCPRSAVFRKATRIAKRAARARHRDISLGAPR
jgi:hypothetical protein